MCVRFCFLALMMFVFMGAGVSFAQEAQEPKERAAYEALMGEISSINDGLDKDQARHFGLVTSSYMLINTVRSVQADVGKAIVACGTNNADMKGALDARYSAWNAAVNPVLSEAKSQVDNMVIVQDYASKDAFDGIFKGVDDTRAETHSGIERIPVTTPEACTYLLNKMDETQAQMIGILRQNLVSYPASSDPEASEE